MNTTRLIAGLISAIIGLAEFLIALRILLKLLAARETAPFVSWVYETSQPLLAPFEGMFPAPALRGGVIIEFSALFGLIVYAIVGYFLTEVVDWIASHSPQLKTRKNSKT